MHVSYTHLDVYKRQGLGAKIGLFYAMQGIVSLFMPAIMGIIADRWVPAQKLYGWAEDIANPVGPGRAVGFFRKFFYLQNVFAVL